MFPSFPTIGVNSNGSVLVDASLLRDDRLFVYHLEYNDSHLFYNVNKHILTPPVMGNYIVYSISFKYLLEDGRLVLSGHIEDQESSNASTITSIYNKDMSLKQDFYGHYGWLKAALSNGTLVYEHYNQIKLYDANDHAHLHTFSAPEPYTWEQGLSACRHPENGYLVVAYHRPPLLHVFNKHGKIITLYQYLFQIILTSTV